MANYFSFLKSSPICTYAKMYAFVYMYVYKYVCMRGSMAVYMSN